MKHFLKTLLVTAAVAVLSIGSLQAQSTSTKYDGDLLIGFTAETGNDLIYDLGPASALSDGKTWNLSSLLSIYDLTTVQWGVVGSTNLVTANATNKASYITVAPGFTPDQIPNRSAFLSISNSIVGMYQLFPAAGAGQSLSVSSISSESWNEQTINGSQPTDYHNLYDNPNVTGNTSASLFVVGTNSAPVLVGGLALGLNGVLTFRQPGSTPPTAPLLGLARVGNVNTISFTATSTATYNLVFTNLSGINTPRSTWFPLASPITGMSGTTTFTDTTTDTNRIYSVSAH
jgi:hypothetical protein